MSRLSVSDRDSPLFPLASGTQRARRVGEGAIDDLCGLGVVRDQVVGVREVDDGLDRRFRGAVGQSEAYEVGGQVFAAPWLSPAQIGRPRRDLVGECRPSGEELFAEPQHVWTRVN